MGNIDSLYKLDDLEYVRGLFNAHEYEFISFEPWHLGHLYPHIKICRIRSIKRGYERTVFLKSFGQKEDNDYEKEKAGLEFAESNGIPAPRLLFGDGHKPESYLAYEYIPNLIRANDSGSSCVDNALKAISEMNSKGLFHGDTDSVNILIDTDGKVVFVDFGKATIGQFDAKRSFEEMAGFLADMYFRGGLSESEWQAYIKTARALAGFES